jgi:hypothetical protein
LVEGTITGQGLISVNGGTLELPSLSHENVTFIATSGILELFQSQTYRGTVGGFSTAGQTYLYLDDIHYQGHDQATFSGTSTGGVLTVTDGTHTAHIALTGDYLGQTFFTGRDPAGGVSVKIRPVRGASAGPASHTFIAAMAGLGASPVADAVAFGGERPGAARLFAAAPRAAIA